MHQPQNYLDERQKRKFLQKTKTLAGKIQKQISPCLK